MFDTKNDLPAKVRTEVIGLLDARLADAVDLWTQAKQAHWNVKGPSFIALHELFDRVAGAVEEHVDALAERITALGGVAHGTVATVARTTSLKAYPENIAAGLEHVEALSSVLADFGRKVRAGIELAARAGDADTSDLFTEISRDVDKHLWLLEAHLHAGS